MRGAWCAHCTPHTAHCTLHTAHCTLHTAHRPGHTHYTLPRAGTGLLTHNTHIMALPLSVASIDTPTMAAIALDNSTVAPGTPSMDIWRVRHPAKAQRRRARAQRHHIHDICGAPNIILMSPLTFMGMNVNRQFMSAPPLPAERGNVQGKKQGNMEFDHLDERTLLAQNKELLWAGFI